MFDLDLSLRILLAAVLLEEGAAEPEAEAWLAPETFWSGSCVASLELETLRLLFRHGDLSFSLLGSGDWASATKQDAVTGGLVWQMSKGHGKDRMISQRKTRNCYFLDRITWQLQILLCEVTRFHSYFLSNMQYFYISSYNHCALTTPTDESITHCTHTIIPNKNTNTRIKKIKSDKTKQTTISIELSKRTNLRSLPWPRPHPSSPPRVASLGTRADTQPLLRSLRPRSWWGPPRAGLRVGSQGLDQRRWHFLRLRLCVGMQSA